MPKAANPATQGVVSAALADTDAVSAPLVSCLKRLRDLGRDRVWADGLDQAAPWTRSWRRLREGRTTARGRGARRREKSRRSRCAGIEAVKIAHPDVSVCDEKVAVAQQCYDLVEQHIARLDKDLRVFDQALAEKEAAAAVAKGAAGRRPPRELDGGAGLASPSPRAPLARPQRRVGVKPG